MTEMNREEKIRHTNERVRMLLGRGIMGAADDVPPADPPADPPPADPPADPPKDDKKKKTAAELAAEAAKKAADDEIAELRKFKKETEEAKLSADEKTSKRVKEAEARIAVLDREAAFMAAGLPKELANETDPTKIAESVKAMVAKGIEGKETGLPIAPAGGVQPTPPKDAKAKAAEDAKPTSDARWDAAWNKKQGKT